MRGNTELQFFYFECNLTEHLLLFLSAFFFFFFSHELVKSPYNWSISKLIVHPSQIFVFFVLLFLFVFVFTCYLYFCSVLYFWCSAVVQLYVLAMILKYLKLDGTKAVAACVLCGGHVFRFGWFYSLTVKNLQQLLLYVTCCQKTFWCEMLCLMLRVCFDP